MKMIRTANGKQKLVVSRKEWETIGIKNGWIKKAAIFDVLRNSIGLLVSNINESTIRVSDILMKKETIELTPQENQELASLCEKISRESAQLNAKTRIISEILDHRKNQPPTK